MTKYSGTVINDKVAVHSSPSKGGGNKIGNPLKTGTVITGVERNAGFMHITTPMDGWVLETDIEFTDTDLAQTTSTINQPTTNLTTDNTPDASANSNHTGIFRLKRWAELDPSDGFSAHDRGGVDQFSFYTPYITDAAGKWCGDWSSNNNFSILTHADIMKIAALQTPDESNLEAKMNWFTWGGEDSWGAPMKCRGKWDEAAEVKMIAAFYAGQMIEVLERKTLLIDFQGKKKDIPMSRIRTFRRADFGKTFATHPHLVQKVTAVDKSNNHREKVKGTVYIPVALGSDFDFAGKFQPTNWWLMDRWIAYDDPAS